MKIRSRVYEVELEGNSIEVRIEDQGSHQDGLGRLYRISIGDAEPVEVVGEEMGNGEWSLISQGRSWEAGVSQTEQGCAVDILGIRHDLSVVDPLRKALRLAGSEGGAVIKSQMPGRVIRLLVEEGEMVEKGSPLLVLEAMKMENEIKAPRGGEVKRIAVCEGDLIEARTLLVELTEV
jgi:biotin carboxyl carrier protein